MDLTTLPHTLWRELELAKDDRQHAWRTPVLASIDNDGSPQARTVVLRNVNSDSQTLQFFTDCRSPKIKQMIESPKIQLIFWSNALKWQLRVSALATIETAGTTVDAAWQQVELGPTRQDYLSPLAPGDALTTELSTELSSTHNLAIITAKVNHMDWLYLDPKGHQRAEFSVEALRWLIP